MTETPNPDQHVGAEGAYPGPDQPQPYRPDAPPAYPQPVYPQPAYQQAPHTQPYGYAGVPGTVTGSDRTWASASHWGTLVAAWLAMGFLAPLVIMFTVGNESPFVRRHAVESLNFQISLLIYSAVGVLVSILTLGLGLIVVIPVFLVALVAILVLVIQASIRAGNGEEYRYPLTIRLVS